MMTVRRIRMLTVALRWVALLAVITGVMPACGGDDGVAATCDAIVAVDEAITVAEDPEAATNALQDLVLAAPDEVAEAVEPLLALMRQDPGPAMESAELATAEAAVDGYAVDSCGDTTIEIEAMNFNFSGMPATVDAGRVVFDVTNASQTGEFHEAVLLRSDGDSSPAEVLEAALDGPVSAEATMGALQDFSLVAAAFVEPDGGDTEDAFVADLEPGRYILVCLLPVNSQELIEPYFGGEAVEGTRHFDVGMYAEFTVD